MVPPAGIEPAYPASEAGGLSIDLRGQSKKLYRIPRRRSIDFFKRNIPEFRNKLRNLQNECWLISFSTMTLGSKVRRIGLDHHLLQRTLPNGLPNFLRFWVCRNPRERKQISTL